MSSPTNVTQSEKILQFEPFSSFVAPQFFQDLGRTKLQTYRLDTTAKEISATYQAGQPLRPGHAASPSTSSAPILVHINEHSIPRSDSAGESPPLPMHSFPLVGTLFLTNTLEEFRNMDWTVLLDQQRQKIWDDITTGRADADPGLLNRFLLVSFANLKSFQYNYWFAFPALSMTPPIRLVGSTGLSSAFDPSQVEELETGVLTWREANPGSPAFLILTFASAPPRILPLAEWEEAAAKVSSTGKLMLGFVDPSDRAGIPAWPLRNLLAWASYRLGGGSHTVVLWRSGPHQVLHLHLPPISKEIPLKVVGWERNTKGKLSPRSVDLAPMMDPTKLADAALDLNLKLMRWRLMPELQLERVSQTKCLLLGAGTLGCYISRILLAWGVRNVTFADSGRVSYSNPARQPLFTFEDCQGGGKDKAPCAAERLKEVFPGVNAKGYVMSIPMPGHPVGSEKEAAMGDVEVLKELILEHDAIFLLMDSRESRWLPTLLGAAFNKVVINVALGFDSFLVMRHGIPSGRSPGSGGDIGCYYCNDVVAPTDSLRNRTLDQQCTVTRPGLAALAGGSAVELLVSLLHHPLGAAAPAQTADEEGSTPLGLLPHQIRGFLGQWKSLLIQGKCYDRCTACSATVLDAYQKGGWEFLENVFADSAYLESVVGLDKLREESEMLASEWDVEEEEGEEDF